MKVKVQIQIFCCNQFYYKKNIYKPMSGIKITAEEIEALLDSRTREMNDHQNNAKYVEAEECRLHVEQLKKDYVARLQYELEERHRNENSELARTHQQELDNFNRFWDKKMEDYYGDGQKLEKDMAERHMSQLKQTREDLDRQLPIKLKQSSELLNLRKMEEHMAKQKNYVEAHKVQERCNAMEKEQKEAWINARNLKIQTALNKLRHKQESQLAALQKKIKTGMDQQTKDRSIQENRLKLKYANVCKQLKMQHDKEVLAHKGQFKSKGGQAASPSMTKSKFMK